MALERKDLGNLGTGIRKKNIYILHPISMKFRNFSTLKLLGNIYIINSLEKETNEQNKCLNTFSAIFFVLCFRFLQLLLLIIKYYILYFIVIPITVLNNHKKGDYFAISLSNFNIHF